MAHDLTEEFVAEHNFVLEAAWKGCLIRIARIPDSGFAHKVETRLMHHRSPFSLRVGPKEDGRAEYALERSNQSPVLCAALLHAEGVKHLRRASKLNRLALL